MTHYYTERGAAHRLKCSVEELRKKVLHSFSKQCGDHLVYFYWRIGIEMVFREEERGRLAAGGNQ